MGVIISNSNYGGEVAGHILTLATTRNELVEKGLIHMVPGIQDKLSIPRMKVTEMIQRRIETPEDTDSQGDFNYSERVLQPRDAMVFTTFNPRVYEHIWKQYQPKGSLVVEDLPPQVQQTMLSLMLEKTSEKFGDQLINGEYVSGGTRFQVFDGIIKRMEDDADKIVVTCADAQQTQRLRAVYESIPVTLRGLKNLCFLMSVSDADEYDVELTQQGFKGVDWTDKNPLRFKGLPIKPLSKWPSGLIVATLASSGEDSNLWGAVNLASDVEASVLIDRIKNASERYFFKMLFKADTQIAFGEEVIWLDNREEAA
ncbi:MAG: hypothetical protein MdMp024_0921 [Bacteroidales bacterium]